MFKPALLALVCAAILVSTWHQSRGTIIENREAFEQRQLLMLAGPGASLVPREIGYDILRQDEVFGLISRHTSSKGYNGRIEIYLARDNEGIILGVDVIDHRETPGLGDRIDDEVSGWIRQFEGRSIDNTNWALAPAGDIDGITGATITARATMDMIREGLAE